MAVRAERSSDALLTWLPASFGSVVNSGSGEEHGGQQGQGRQAAAVGRLFFPMLLWERNRAEQWSGGEVFWLLSTAPIWCRCWCCAA